MSDTSLKSNRTKVLLLIMSLLAFILSVLTSVLGYAVLVLAAIAFFISKWKLAEFSEIKKDTYIYGFVVVLAVALANKFENFLISVPCSILSYYFVIQAIEFLKTLFSKRKVDSSNLCDGRLNLSEIVTIVLTSVVTMVLNTTSSPLYQINYWGDAHMYFTLGKSINNGLVLYRDVFDHKGPYIYFLHGLAARICGTSFIGIFIIEIVCAIVFSMFVWKTVKLFYKPRCSWILIPLQIVTSYFTYSFWYGDSAEELCIPLLSIVVYIALKAEKNGTLPSFKETIVIGVISGYLFLFKFNFCALIIGYLIYVIISSIVRKNISLMFKDVGAFLIGVLIAAIPVIIYFTVNNAWSDFFEVYFYENIVLYPQLSNTHTGKYISIIHFSMVDNPSISAMLCLSLFAVGAMKKGVRYLYLSMLLLQSVFLFGVHYYLFYYCLIYLALTAISWILITVVFDYVYETFRSKSLLLWMMPVILCGAIMFGFVGTCRNFYFLSQNEEDVPQLTFAKIINEVDNPTILTYGTMDSSFYTYADVIPNCKYCFKTNMDNVITDHVDYQNEMIANGEFDFIITSAEIYEWDNYELIAEQIEYAYENSPSNGVFRINTPQYLYQKVK